MATALRSSLRWDLLTRLITTVITTASLIQVVPVQVLADHTGNLQLWLRYIAEQHSQRAASVRDIRLAFHQGLQVLHVYYLWQLRIELVQRREMYGCSPSALRQPDFGSELMTGHVLQLTRPGLLSGIQLLSLRL